MTLSYVLVGALLGMMRAPGGLINRDLLHGARWFHAFVHLF